MADQDVIRERRLEQGHRAVCALQKFLDERGVDLALRGHVFAIHGRLGQFDDREARRFALDEMEWIFSVGQTAWARQGRRAVALWRLHQQQIDHRD